ncbi:serine/threonine protein kinase [Elusimicrobium posterum]|uniref:serine/threonine protein kinase n=1 Tax=Elusimicrobium posterum TaxID=3116653 RepID=UPI003C719AD9
MAEDNKKLDPLIGQEISGCEILEKVAVGGMGAVFKARHKALDRIVCVKILSPALADDKKAVSLFLTEARAIAELDHPNIVNVYNVGREKGFYFIVMSFISGDTVSNIVRRRPNLPIGFILNIFQGVLKGLSVAHEKGIIHRDIKPSNILINDKLEPKIVDFGIAKKIDKDRSTTKTTEMAGTAYFISPEQAMGGEIDVRADLYSAGATLFFMLTGQFPYKGKNSIEIIQKHINDPIPNPSDLRKDIPAWVSMTVEKLMAKKPDNRFQSAQEVLDHIVKMRAEDQLKIKKGESTALDISSEVGLRVRAEANYTENSQFFKRHTLNSRIEKEKKAITETARPKIPVLGAKDVPAVGPSKEAKKSTTPPAPPQQSPHVNPLNNIAALEGEDTIIKDLKKEAKMLKRQSNKLPKMLARFFFHMPLFLLLTISSAFIFGRMGKIAASLVAEGANVGVLLSLKILFYGRVLLADPKTTVAMFLLIVLIFVSASIKIYSRQFLTLIFIAGFSYLGGFFGPDINLLNAFFKGLGAFTEQSYLLAYAVLAFLFALGILWSKTPVLVLRAVCCVAVVITIIFVKFFTNLPVVPADNELVSLILYSSIIMTVSCAVIVVPKTFVYNSILPTALFVLAVFSLWGYNVSGYVYDKYNKVVADKEIVALLEKEGVKDSTLYKPSKQAVVSEHILDLNFGSSLLGVAKTVDFVTTKDDDESVLKKEGADDKEKQPKKGESDKKGEAAKKEEENPLKSYVEQFKSQGGAKLMRTLWVEGYKQPVWQAVATNADTAFFKFAAALLLLVTNIYFGLHMVFRKDL